MTESSQDLGETPATVQQGSSPSPLGRSESDPSNAPGDAAKGGPPRSLQPQLETVSVLSYTPQQVSKEGLRLISQVQ